MATTNTTTAVKSFTKTPQAGDDTYAMLESDTDAVLLDVMSNDLGGASKTLWSLDDGDYLTDLLIKESVESVPSTSEMGVTITIVDGQVRYDISSAPQDFRNALESLAEGEVGYDTFTYAIRLGNGTLSWATVWVKFTGTNDAPVLTIDTSGGVTEDATAPDLTDSGALSITDVDATDTHVVSAAYNDDAAWSDGPLSAAQAEAFAAGFSVDGTGWTYTVSNAAVQFLGAGETITLSFDVTVTDDSGTADDSDTETVSVTITGTNDAPVISVGADDEDTAALTETDAGLTAGGTLTISDVDQLDTVDVSVTGLAVSGTGGTGLAQADLLAMMTIGDDGAWSFDTGSAAFDNLADGQILVLTYTVTADDGVDTGDHEIAITITGTNDGPVVSGAVEADVDEGDTASTLDALANATDVDDGDTLSVTNVPATLPDGVSYDAAAHSFTFDPADGAYDHLAAGAVEVVSVTYDVTDGDETASATVSWTITGTNDAPVVTSNGGLATASVSVAENTTAVTTVTATDVDSANLAYSISGGADAALFSIDATTGALTFVNAPNFEAPADAGGDNVYDVVVQASDGSLADTQAIAVTVTDVAEVTAPVSPAVYTGTDDPFDFDTAPATAIYYEDVTNSQLSNPNTLKGSTGADSIDGKGNNDTIYGLAGDDVIKGGNGIDTVYGGEGGDTITGDEDTDTLYGGSGNDTINGKQGADTIIGGYGADTLTGEGGTDTFVYLSALDTGDTIGDFTQTPAGSQDQIDLSAFGGLNFEAADTNAVVANSVTWHFDGANTQIWADTTGDTTADLQITLIGEYVLTTSDFIL